VDKARLRLDGYAKRFKFIMEHDIGKIEICGRVDDKAGRLDDMDEIHL